MKKNKEKNEIGLFIILWRTMMAVPSIILFLSICYSWFWLGKFNPIFMNPIIIYIAIVAGTYFYEYKIQRLSAWIQLAVVTFVAVSVNMKIGIVP